MQSPTKAQAWAQGRYTDIHLRKQALPAAHASPPTYQLYLCSFWQYSSSGIASTSSAVCCTVLEELLLDVCNSTTVKWADNSTGSELPCSTWDVLP